IKSALPFNRAGFLTGTSQATAFVSGVVAMLKSRFPKLSYIEIKEIIRSSAKKGMAFASNSISGGRLDARAAIISAEKRKINGSILRDLAKVKN
ncbi:MAG: hypothetical protein DRQ88_05825, partial [Epsilonproteobacteria bacterium]